MLTATVAGNLGGDAQVRQVGQQSVCEFSVASSRRGRDGAEQTTWVRCSLWGKRGEALAPRLLKGQKVACVGELSARAYQARDGSPAAGLDLRVWDVALQGGPQQGQGQAPQAATYAPQAPSQGQYAPQGRYEYDDIPF